MTTTTCPCMPEYDGPCEVADVAQGECLDCGYTTTDHHDLLMWNGYGDHAGPTWSESCKRSRWTMTDGTVTDVDEDGNEIAEDRWCCGSCGLQFAHDEGVHTVQHGTFHEFVCNSCRAAERADA